MQKNKQTNRQKQKKGKRTNRQLGNNTKKQ